MNRKAIIASVVALAAASANAAIVVTEVAPWSSGNSPVAADWFELTNTGPGTVSISGWKMDDDSANPNSAPLAGITDIAEGESVIFLELASGGNAATLTNNFRSTWFGGSAPIGLQIGTYTQGPAGGVGLGTGGDQVNIFDNTNALQSKVLFGASDNLAPFQTFDNSFGSNNFTLSTFSIVGVNNAFAISTVNGGEVGSPGSIPEPTALGLLGLGSLAFGARRRRA